MFKVNRSFFSPAPGRYIGTFLGVSDGPVLFSEYSNEEEQKVKWSFALSDLSGNAIIDPATGEQAVGETLTNQSTGERSKSRKWLTKLLAAQELPFIEPATEADFLEQVDQAVGAEVQLIFGTNGSGKTSLMEMEALIFAPAVAPPPNGGRPTTANRQAPRRAGSPPFPTATATASS